jgi:hypothetical protein
MRKANSFSKAPLSVLPRYKKILNEIIKETAADSKRYDYKNWKDRKDQGK